ncbi:hypothetical protein [Prosthecobacter sp.]|uniref:hypothetical protein n=1 Tax=Prosthecobacter sp. TaxID=1965333 RepID=UPI0024891DC3|nr:hypothetical protein [Prosthecobacter sp.]MDI1315092.1 hypothetical protein [Prosthecobacter sp.]
MKNFKVFLNFGGASFIPAERWEQEDGWYKFYREDSVIAEFAAMSVEKIEERSFPPESNGAGK